jgi:hypothetical protein
VESDSIEMDERQPVSSLEEPKRDESVAAETPSFLPRTGPNSFLSKHRMAAAITQLQSQISSIQVSFHVFCSSSTNSNKLYSEYYAITKFAGGAGPT